MISCEGKVILARLYHRREALCIRRLTTNNTFEIPQGKFYFVKQEKRHIRIFKAYIAEQQRAYARQ